MASTTPRLLIPYPDENTPAWDLVFEAMVLAIDASLYTPREDRNILIFGGGQVAFTASTGILTWSADINLLSSVTGYKWIIPAGQVTLADGQLFYITVTRAPVTNTTYSPILGLNTPNQPNGDNQVLIGIRVGTAVHFREGFIIGDGQSMQLFDSSAAGLTPGGDLSGNATAQTVIGFDGTPLDSSMVGPADGSLIKKVGGKWAAITTTSLRGSVGFFNAMSPFTTTLSSFTTAAVIEFDPTIIPATSAIKLKVIVETTGPQITVQLYNVTASAVVTGTTLTSSSTTPIELVTSDLTSAITNGDAIYQVQIKMSTGSPGDMISLDMARLEATWA